MPDKIQINLAELNIIKNILQTNLPKDTKIWAFGSRALCKAKTFSDLDLAIELENNKPLELSILGKLEVLFEESNLPWQVDIVDYNTAPENFRLIIDSSKVIL